MDMRTHRFPVSAAGTWSRDPERRTMQCVCSHGFAIPAGIKSAVCVEQYLKTEGKFSGIPGRGENVGVTSGVAKQLPEGGSIVSVI